MKWPPVAEHPHSDASAFQLVESRSQFHEPRLDLPSGYVATDQMAEDRFECFPVLAAHES